MAKPKLKRDLPLPEIERMIAGANEWVRLVPNEREATIRQLTPAAVTGNLEIHVGRLRKLELGAGYLGGFLPLIAGVIVASTGDIYSGLWYTWAVVAFGLLVAWWGIPDGPPRDFEEHA